MRPSTEQRAAVNGIEIEYDVVGTGEPVLCISPVLADGFRPLVTEPSLATRYQLITYFKRGWGGSTHPTTPVSIADHAEDAAALLAHLDLPRAHVAGHSSGAAVAVQLALAHPSRVQSLALLELSLLSAPAAPAFMQAAAPAFEAYAGGQHERALALFLSTVSGLDWDTCRALLEERAPGAAAAALEDVDTFFGVELPALGAWSFGAAEAQRISAPVLSVYGTDTAPLWIEIASLLRRWMPQVEECVIEGAGHLLHVQRPRPVADGLAAFFDRHRLDA